MCLQGETIVTDRAPREASEAPNLIFYSYPIRTTPHVSPPDISPLSPLSSLLSPLSAAGLGFLSRRPSLGRVSGIRSMHVQQQQYWLLRMQQAYST